jgi:hypothetical protein
MLTQRTWRGRAIHVILLLWRPWPRRLRGLTGRLHALRTDEQPVARRTGEVACAPHHSVVPSERLIEAQTRPHTWRDRRCPHTPFEFQPPRKRAMSKAAGSLRTRTQQWRLSEEHHLCTGKPTLQRDLAAITNADMQRPHPY